MITTAVNMIILLVGSLTGLTVGLANNQNISSIMALDARKLSFQPLMRAGTSLATMLLSQRMKSMHTRTYLELPLGSPLLNH